MTDKPPVRMESLDGGADGRRFSPSAGRNRGDIVAALMAELPKGGLCLEVAAGTGEHAVLAAERLPGWEWWPTERDPEALASLRAWVEHAGLSNLRQPTALDLQGEWPCEPNSLDAVFACNVMHISPWATTEALFRGASRHLSAHGSLVIYGAVFLSGEPPPEGNLRFDQELRQQDPEYGVRRLEDLNALALRCGMQSPVVRRMPNDNVLLRLEMARQEIDGSAR